MVKKVFVFVLIVMLTTILFGCNNKKDESVRLQVYQTKYNGTPTTSYPYKLLTNNNILELIEKYKKDDKTEVDKLKVMYLIKFYDESSQVNELMVMNNGQISWMIHGLKYGEYIVSADGLDAITNEIEK